MRRLSRATTEEILKASPYKTVLSKAKARNARSGSLGKKPFPKLSSAKQTRSTKKQASFKHKQTGTKKGESDWYCFICMESVMDDMIQCQVCNTWVHRAAHSLLKRAQAVCYREEVDSLVSGDSISRSSHILSLDPVLNHGLLVVGGRLKRKWNGFTSRRQYLKHI